MNRDVVVTGMGVVSPIGNNLNEFREALKQGKSGESEIARFDTEKFPIKKACEVKGFRPGWKTKILDPFIQYALCTADEAVRDAGFLSAFTGIYGANTKETDPYRLRRTSISWFDEPDEFCAVA